VKELKSNLSDGAKQTIKLQFETDNPNSGLKIINPVHDSYPINVSHALANLMGTGTALGSKTYVKKLNSPSAYFIHCDLIDPKNNFYNGKRTDILSQNRHTRYGSC